MVEIAESRKKALGERRESPEWAAIARGVRQEIAAGQKVFPAGENIFRAFDLTPFEKVKVVILGQDPYHGPGQAMGLSFSVPESVRIPPSLRNVFKEIRADLGHPVPVSGDLTRWAERGVFLLNAMLTVRAGEPASHRALGWQHFTDRVIATLSAERENLVFLLWGKFAEQKKVLIDEAKHLVLTAPHPSPLSAHAGFLGCGHFSRANEFLVERGVEPVDWNLVG